ncbi:hypothetical protein LY16_02390 [Xenorhabdus doucetiae]|uniref:Uncharacterized protein n=1 Tax=Xenorhabdus doucetiae TaxID=351671 RepID=A0ABY3NQ12_9GAMM|nr:hypothetical protein LY16_02390 [Xenorhabdus doucetiae]
MKLLVLHVTQFSVFFVLFALVNYFFILNRNKKKSIKFSLIISAIYLLTEIFSFHFLMAFYYISTLFMDVNG